MKKVSCFLLLKAFFWFNINTISCQLLNDSCQKDSTNNLEFDILIDDLFENQFEIKDKLDLFLREKDKKCTLLFYANIFNKLQKEGLDLDYDISKNPPTSNSTFFALESMHNQMKKEIEDINKFYYDYVEFLNYNKSYKRFIKIKYSDSLAELEEQIDLIISYNLFVKPHELKNILLLKFSHHTIKRLGQDPNLELRNIKSIKN